MSGDLSPQSKYYLNLVTAPAFGSQVQEDTLKHCYPCYHKSSTLSANYSISGATNTQHTYFAFLRSLAQLVFNTKGPKNCLKFLPAPPPTVYHLKEVPTLVYSASLPGKDDHKEREPERAWFHRQGHTYESCAVTSMLQELGEGRLVGGQPARPSEPLPSSGAGVSLRWLPLLPSSGAGVSLSAVPSLAAELRLQGAQASVAVVQGLGCPTACGIFRDQVSNWCPLRCKVDS